MRKKIVVLALGMLMASILCFAESGSGGPLKLSGLPEEAQHTIATAISIQNFTLSPSDGVDGAGFGLVVAIDGNTVVVGADGLAAAYVFVKPASGWANMTQTAKLTSSDSSDFGYSVAISGNTIVVGCEANSIPGAVCVFVKPPTGWTDMTQTAQLTASDGLTGSGFGESVAISGNTVLAGAQFAENPNNGGPGAAYIFVKPAGGWKDMTQTAEVTPSDGYLYDYFGTAVAIDGDTAIVATYQPCGNCSPPGAAYVFVRPATGWVNTTETAKLTASDGQPSDFFGRSLGLSAGAAVVGAAGDATAYVFVEPSGGWESMTETAQLTGAGADSVAISGNTILVSKGQGAGGSTVGHAFVFLKPTGGWRSTSQYNHELTVNFPLGGDNFGDYAALSGSTGIVGAYDAPTSLPCHFGRCQAGPGEAILFMAK